MTEKKKGRPDGSKTKRRYGGVFKKCRCRSWSKCLRHPWHMTFRSEHRFQLDKAADRLGVPHPKSSSEALRVRSKVIDRILDGTWTIPKEAPASIVNMRLTMRDVVKPYLDYFANQTWRGKPRRPHRVTRLANQLALICRKQIPAAKSTLVLFGDVGVADVTTPDIEAWREAHHAHMNLMERERIDRAKRIHAGDEQARKLPVSVERPRSQDGNVGLNRNLEVIRQWLNWAIKKGHRDAENPCYRHGVEIIEFTDEFDRTRRLLPGEEDRLLKAATALDDRWSHVHDLIVAALESGCRKGELLSLQWGDVECDAKTKPLALSLRAGTTKMNDGRRIPLSPRLSAVLEMRRTRSLDGHAHPPTAFVFGDACGDGYDSIKTGWASVCEDATVTC